MLHSVANMKVAIELCLLLCLSSLCHAQMREGTAAVPGARLHYRDSGGDGVPVVLLHAFGGTSESFENQFPTLAAKGYRVIAYDRRGFGQTTFDAGADPGTQAGDLAAFLDVLGLDRVHLIGTATGGIVALDFALSYPSRLRTLVIANSVGSLSDPEIAAIRRRLALPQGLRIPMEFMELSPAYRAANPEGTKHWIEIKDRNSTAAHLPAPQPFRSSLTLASLETIQVPTLLIGGGADMTAPAPLQELLAAHLRTAKLTILPDVGHSAYWEEPDKFNNAVLAFIKEH